MRVVRNLIHWKILALALFIFLFTISCRDRAMLRREEISYPVVDHPIQIRLISGKAEFYNHITGAPFTPHGVNDFNLVERARGGYEDRFFGVGVFDEGSVYDDFKLLKSKGYNVVRIFLDQCSEGTGCTGNPSGDGLNPLYLDNIVKAMRVAKKIGLYLLLTSNDLPGQGGYWDISERGRTDQFGPYRNTHYLTPSGIEAGYKYWGDMLNGLARRNAPFETIFAWELLNEQWYTRTDPPFSLTSGLVTTANGLIYNMSSVTDKKQMALDGMIYYIAQMSKAIRQVDPKSLITMGFFVPDYPNATRPGDSRYVETSGLIPVASVDFFDFHAYPGDLSLRKHAENFGMIGYEKKAVLMGEYGAFISIYTSEADALTTSRSWMAESCLYGFDGWLYWGLRRAPDTLGDGTWSFLDGSRSLLTGLSPITMPNPCDPLFLPPDNLALDKVVTTSNFLPENPPEAAVDGNFTTSWIAGSGPTQWIEVDLGAPHRIDNIQLKVSQYPDGFTSHRVLLRGTSGTYTEAHVFSGTTATGDILSHTFTTPPTGIRYVRIETTTSPSWVSWFEIEVFGI